MAAQKSYGQEHSRPSKEFQECVAANLRRIRTEKRLSVESLARQAGVSTELVQKAERGDLEGLNIGDLEPFAQALGVEVMALVERESPKGV